MTVRDSALPAAQQSSSTLLPAAVLAALGPAIERLRFGLVQLTVHDGKVVQLDVTERQRF